MNIQKRCFRLTVAAAIISFSTAISALAGCWNHTEGYGCQWLRDDGSCPLSCWEWIDDNNDGKAECYYFNEYGCRLQNTQAPDGSYVNENGAWIVDGAVQQKEISQEAPVSTPAVAGRRGHHGNGHHSRGKRQHTECGQHRCR